MSLISSSLVCCLLVWILYKIICSSPTICTAPRRIYDLAESLLLLRQSTLSSRALPNQRLVTTFGIDNAFTTTDPDWHREFVRNARDLLHTSDEEWKFLARFARDHLRDKLGQLGVDNPILLTKLVQVLVFKVVLKKFFPSTQEPSDHDVEYITSTINTLWITSKSRVTLAELSQLCNEKRKLIIRIRQVFNIPNNCPVEGKDNPLNIVLPAYETLWRVVLRCFLEVRFRARPGQAWYSLAGFMQLQDAPTRENFEKRCPHGGISIQSIVSEALRLYPPTRRIYRDVGSEVLAVDVEHLHRDEMVWGDDALVFDPRRWSGREKTQAYMPFGMGKFECPAKNVVGPMMIGILAGVLCLGIGGVWELEFDDGEGLGEGPLCGARDALGKLKVLRKKMEWIGE